MSNARWEPPPSPGEPQPGRPASGLRTLVIGLSAGLALLLVATVAVVNWVSPSMLNLTATAGSSATATPQQGSPAGVATATAAPPAPAGTAAAPDPTPARPSAVKPPSPDYTLTTNSIYGVDLAGSSTCTGKVRSPRPPLKTAALAPYLRSVVSCLVTTFRGPLAKQGFTLTTPHLRTFTRSVSTPCGKVSARTNPAFYCAGTIYWPSSGDDGREAYTYARLGYVGLLAHEFGHHLQATTGMLYAYSVRYRDSDAQGRYALSRRLELQAQCFEGVFLAQTAGYLDFSRRDRAEIRLWHSMTGDEDPPDSRKPDHGSSRAQLKWLERGLAGADFGRCNTWSASGEAVK